MDFENITLLFDRAVKWLSIYGGGKKIKVNDENKLKFYSWFKQATSGDCSTKKPSFFDFVGRAKWSHWNSVHGMEKHTAMQNYVDNLTRLCPTWEMDDVHSDSKEAEPNKKEGTSFGPKVSTLGNPSKDDAEYGKEENINRYVVENNKKVIEKMISKDPSLVNYCNQADNNMRPLFYAVDRGLYDMCTFLLTHSANIHAQDGDGQTALHYAVICGQTNVAKLLLEHGADPNQKDDCGESCFDICDDETIASLLAPHRN